MEGLQPDTLPSGCDASVSLTLAAHGWRIVAIRNYDN